MWSVCADMKKEFNLSETSDTLLNKRIYTEDNVKEFIKNIKSELLNLKTIKINHAHFINGNDVWILIDKLVGDKLK